MNPFSDYFSNLSPNGFVKIIRHLDISSIESLKSAFPYLSRVINESIIELTSNREYTTDLRYYFTAVNLESCDDEITFNISGVYELINLSALKKLKHINICIDKPLNNEYDSLLYLENMIYNLFPSNDSEEDTHENDVITTMDKTYRLMFRTTKEYAYILDRGFFCTVNCNQLRNYQFGALNRIDWLNGVKLILRNKLKGIPIKDCIYSCKKNQNLRDVPDYFDAKIHDKFEEEILINLTKVDDKGEIYYIDDFVKEILISNFNDPAIFEGLEGITKEILSIVLFQYGKNKNLYISSDKELFFKMWKDEIFIKSFPMKQAHFKEILKKNTKLTKEVRKLLQQAADGKITTNNLTNLIVGLLQPADYIPMNKIKMLYLPPERSYLDPKISINILEFMVEKVNTLIDNLKKKV